jgi:pyruvate-formate lyase
LCGFRSRDKIELLLDQLLRQNKELDKKYQELIQLAKKCDVPATEMPGLYKEIVQFYTEMNKAINDLYKDSITNGKSIRKLHEYVTKQTEKYIKEMENSIK